MDGENKGSKPYFLMDDLGSPPIFLVWHPYSNLNDLDLHLWWIIAVSSTSAVMHLRHVPLERAIFSKTSKAETGNSCGILTLLVSKEPKEPRSCLESSHHVGMLSHTVDGSEIRLTSWHGKYRIIYRVLDPRWVFSPDFFHQQYPLFAVEFPVIMSPSAMCCCRKSSSAAAVCESGLKNSSRFSEVFPAHFWVLTEILQGIFGEKWKFRLENPWLLCFSTQPVGTTLPTKTACPRDCFRSPERVRFRSAQAQ